MTGLVGELGRCWFGVVVFWLLQGERDGGVDQFEGPSLGGVGRVILSMVVWSRVMVLWVRVAMCSEWRGHRDPSPGCGSTEWSISHRGSWSCPVRARIG